MPTQRSTGITVWQKILFPALSHRSYVGPLFTGGAGPLRLVLYPLLIRSGVVDTLPIVMVDPSLAGPRWAIVLGLAGAPAP